MNKLPVVMMILLSGCAAYFTVPSEQALKEPFPPIQEKTTTELYHPRFSNEAVHKEGLAILGVLKGGPEGLRQNAAFELFQGLREVFPDSRVVPRSDVVNRARSEGRLPALDVLLRSYEERRVIEAASLREWGRIEGVRYFFIAQVPLNDKHMSTRMVQAGEDGVAGKVSVFSSGPEHIPDHVEKTIALTGEIWDAVCGKRVWMGTSHTEVSEPVRLERVRVEDLFTILTRNLISEMDKTMREKGLPVFASTDSSSGC